MSPRGCEAYGQGPGHVRAILWRNTQATASR